MDEYIEELIKITSCHYKCPICSEELSIVVGGLFGTFWEKLKSVREQINFVPECCRDIKNDFFLCTKCNKHFNKFISTSKFELINQPCIVQGVDAIVNAANRNLWSGGGVCGAIYKNAGYKELNEACSKYNTPLKDGDAVITPAFNLINAKCIIHAVGPDFGHTPTAFKELFNAYYNSLLVLKDNNLHSIAFPLISSGIFGGSLENPVRESTEQCVKAYNTFVSKFPEYEIDVKLCAYTIQEMHKASEVTEYENYLYNKEIINKE